MRGPARRRGGRRAPARARARRPRARCLSRQQRRTVTAGASGATLRVACGAASRCRRAASRRASPRRRAWSNGALGGGADRGGAGRRRGSTQTMSSLGLEQERGARVVRDRRRRARSAAARAAATMRGRGPSRVSGSARSVVHSAAAAAPAREHSRLISPRCSSSEVKYVYGESWAYSRPDAGIGEQRRSRSRRAGGRACAGRRRSSRRARSPRTARDARRPGSPPSASSAKKPP